MNRARQWVYWIGDPLPKDVADMKELLGGKGASLAAMNQAGLNVPPAFTISTECCRYFFENGEKWPDGLKNQIHENLERMEKATGRSFGKGSQPLFVSVRSGAAVSMPGMMNTLLNCGIHAGLVDDLGDSPQFWRVYIQFILMFAKTAVGIDLEAFTPSATPPAASAHPSRGVAQLYLKIYEEKTSKPFPSDPWQSLVECINAVFQSWNSERAIAYRERNDIRGLPGTAVTIQAMFPSHVSGVLFTEDPTDLSVQQMVIESSYGLGEAVVSGDVTPDRFVVKRGDFRKIQTVLGKKSRAVLALGDEGEYDAQAASLTPGQIAELCQLAVQVESLYGTPMDIEWGWADGRFALLQCRPIRGLDVAREIEIGRKEEIARLREMAADKRRVWAVHNLSETLRFPTPLTWDIIQHFMSGDGGHGRMYRDFGYRPSRDVCERGFLELICGRIYADPDRLANLYWDSMPLGYDRDAVLKDKSVLDRAPTQFDPEKVSGRFFLKFPGVVVAMLRSALVIKRARRAAKQVFEERVLPPYLEYVHAKRNENLSVLSTAKVIAELDERRFRVLDDFGKEWQKTGFAAAMAFDMLESRMAKLMGKEKAAQLVCALTAGLEGDTTFEQDALLYRVATGEATLDEFLTRFGHRAAGEMELAEPRWREDQTYLHQIIRQIQAYRHHCPIAMHQENVRRREEAEKQLPQILKQHGGRAFQDEIEQNLRDARSLLPYREAAKDYLMMGYELIRLAILELGRRWNLDNDVFFLHLEELEQFEGERNRLLDEIARRKLRWQSFQRLDLPDVIDSTNLENLARTPKLEAVAELKGDPVAPGLATGTARLVFDARAAGDLGDDYILVCPSTDPGWTPLFLNAAGLIVERGGILSHGAIVARDFGIPAVVCHEATRLIRDGDKIHLDGNRGLINILEKTTGTI